MSESEHLFNMIRSFKNHNNPENSFLNFCRGNLSGVERLHFDYKEKHDRRDAILHKNDLKNLAKAVSGFANSSGGILIWGLRDRNLTKKEITAVEGFLANIIQQSTFIADPTVQGINGDFILCANSSSEGYAILHIPESPLPPHRVVISDPTIQHRYFFRTGDSFVVATHTQIEDLFGRRPKPILSLDTEFSVNSSTARKKIDLDVYFEITNSGRSVAKYPFLSVDVSEPYEINRFGIDGNGHFGLNPLTSPLYANSRKQRSFGGGSDDVIHPGSTLSVFTVRIDVDIEKSADSIDDIVIIYQLSSDGIQPQRNELKISGTEIRQSASEFVQSNPERF